MCVGGGPLKISGVCVAGVGWEGGGLALFLSGRTQKHQRNEYGIRRTVWKGGRVVTPSSPSPNCPRRETHPVQSQNTGSPGVTHLPDHLGSTLSEGPVPQTGHRWLWDPGHSSQGMSHCPCWHDSRWHTRLRHVCFNPGQEIAHVTAASQRCLGDQRDLHHKGCHHNGAVCGEQTQLLHCVSDAHTAHIKQATTAGALALCYPLTQS